MQFSRSDLADLTDFLAVAQRRRSRQTGLDPRVGGCALSHSLRTLEERTGVVSVHRTTRSVAPTAACRSACKRDFGSATPTR